MYGDSGLADQLAGVIVKKHVLRRRLRDAQAALSLVRDLGETFVSPLLRAALSPAAVFRCSA
jgi:hypothetical protein